MIFITLKSDLLQNEHESKIKCSMSDEFRVKQTTDYDLKDELFFSVEFLIKMAFLV